MKFNVALCLAAIFGGATAAPALRARQAGCPAPTEVSCKELHDRCVAQGSAVLANPWNNRVCVAAATCYGVGNLLTSYSCRLGVNPPTPSTLPSLSTSFFPNPTTQQNYVDFYYGTINAAWPSSVNVVTGYWAPIISWINTGSSAPYNNLNDWFHWSSTPTTVTAGPTTTPTTTTPTNTPTPTGCVAPTDATCADIVNGCVTGPSWNSNPWSQKKCVAAATCFGPAPLLAYGHCVTGLTFPAQGSAPAISSSVWSSITGSTTAAMTPQNFVDLIYSSVASAWPSSPDFVKNTWLAPIQSWANTGTNIPQTNFNDYLHFFTGNGGGGNPGGGGGGPGSGPQLTGIQTTCHHGVGLSYDDGPYVWNQEIVNLYKNNNAKTTFFVNGNNWDCIYNQDRVDDLRYAYESGMTIGSHTWFHTDITTITDAQLGAELDRIEDALWKIIGIKPALFRPPYGSINAEKTAYLNSRGYTVVTWDCDTGDSVGASVSESMNTVRQCTHDTSMILSHETYQSTAEQLAPQMISYIQGLGLTIQNIDQCLDVSPYQAIGSYQTRDSTWTC